MPWGAIPGGAVGLTQGVYPLIQGVEQAVHSVHEQLDACAGWVCRLGVQAGHACAFYIVAIFSWGHIYFLVSSLVPMYL